MKIESAKERTIPKRVFRYFPPERIDSLESNLVAFTPPIRFNDVFELRPVIVPITELTDLTKIAKSGLNKALRRVRIGPFSSKEAETAFLKEQLERLVPQLETTSTEIAARLQAKLPVLLARRWGAVCLSEVNDNPLMWANYTDNHRGFVVEYNTAHPAFKQLGPLKRVSYGASRPRFNIFNPGPGIFLRKGLDWKYEREWRIFRPLSSCQKRTVGGFTLYFCDLSLGCVSAIYLGNRIEPAIAKRILDLTKQSAFRIFKTTPHQKTFRLVFDEVKNRLSGGRARRSK